MLKDYSYITTSERYSKNSTDSMPDISEQADEYENTDNGNKNTSGAKAIIIAVIVIVMVAFIARLILGGYRNDA